MSSNDGENQEKKLPGSERTTIQMNEIRARVIPDSAILQLQGNPADFTKTDAGNEKIDCLPFDMETVTCGPAAALD